RSARPDPIALGFRSDPSARDTATVRPTTLASELAGTVATPSPDDTRTSRRSLDVRTWPASTDRDKTNTRVPEPARAQTVANTKAEPTTSSTPATIQRTCRRRATPPT